MLRVRDFLKIDNPETTRCCSCMPTVLLSFLCCTFFDFCDSEISRSLPSLRFLKTLADMQELTLKRCYLSASRCAREEFIQCEYLFWFCYQVLPSMKWFVAGFCMMFATQDCPGQFEHGVLWKRAVIIVFCVFWVLPLHIWSVPICWRPQHNCGRGEK